MADSIRRFLDRHCSSAPASVRFLPFPCTGNLERGTWNLELMAIRPAARVRSMFDAVAARYDFLNHLLSAGLDRSWREVLSDRVRSMKNGREAVGGGSVPRPSRPGRGAEAPPTAGSLPRPLFQILDLCCGTGDQAFSLQGAVRGARVTGADFSLPMVDLARRKAGRRGGRGPAFLGGDAMRLPFRDGTFDAATVSFGLRNLADYDAGLCEMARVVRPGGGVYVLEFQMPTAPVIRDAYGFYFRRVLPAVGPTDGDDMMTRIRGGLDGASRSRRPSATGMRSREDLVHAHRLRGVRPSVERVIGIPDHVSSGLVPGERLAQLLRGPRRCRMVRHGT